MVDRGAGEPGSAELARALVDGWVVVRAVDAGVGLRDALLVTLDSGEANALALAVELRAELVLIDERKARALAAQLHMPVKGTLGLLLSAEAAGLLPLVSPVLRGLIAAGLWMSEGLVRDVLALAGESDEAE